MLKHLRRTAGWLIASSLVPAVWAQGPKTTTPIKYVVVIFQENNSFDHYFGTYPNALYPNGQPSSAQYPAGESPFTPLPNTPSINGITPAISNLNVVAPFRLDRSQALTCDNNNGYNAEQIAYNSGQINKFATTSGTGTDPNGNPCTPDLSLGYYDGNTVTALWNYAQYFAMSDNYFDTEFGVTEEGHQNLVSGQTHTASTNLPASAAGKVVNGSIIANVEAGVDDCVVASTKTAPVVMTSKNVGDLLNAAGITWGWFYGDFPESGGSTPITSTQCTATPSGNTYNSHYSPFMYYQTTSNQHHLSPSSVAAIGTSADQANHNYSLVDFQNAINGGNLPSVTFLKAPTTETGHPANSTPLEEQTFLVDTINMLQQTPFWPQMAIFITYDDSDGWYDHVMPVIVNQSNDASNDVVAGSLLCGTPQSGAYLDRCGYGTRLPLLVISPYAKQNYVDHALTDTTSVTRFIEDNWNLGRLGNQSFDALAGSLDGLFDFTDTPRAGRELILNDQTGTVVTAK